ncbi:putative S-adenosylmethionine-dependent methyltransferase [Halomicronema hongdechloris C2206]|uniref:S-adenosylmethionine-dependent methyltransferase n=1 Tax=Halomicronema hongdechloris C2206 TaxID=1641165 RepID=A0A1Z3HKB8_9CYAN|nr:class I SAM-dependent methyltransferase [Halomicronema hongdechloris]ASC70764.1 putative S-adenosylmethionine-dependent methyltransferase [Halomicronema hongdechloris C2206]
MVESSQAPADTRSWDDLRHHYLIEKELANRLRHSTRTERIEHHLYTTLYDELFRRVPHHSQRSRKATDFTRYLINQRVDLITHFNPSSQGKSTLLDIGCGDGHLVKAASPHFQTVYALDVSAEIVKQTQLPDNATLVLSNGVDIPVPAASVDTAFSHQLMEHLHPDDAVEQLQAIFNSLKPGGCYICITPNRLCGPHDISKHFDAAATGFHLKEYTVSELYSIFKQANFAKVLLCKISGRSRVFTLTLNPVIVQGFRLVEAIVERQPRQRRHKIANNPLLFRNITLVGIK